MTVRRFCVYIIPHITEHTAFALPNGRAGQAMYSVDHINNGEVMQHNVWWFNTELEANEWAARVAPRNPGQEVHVAVAGNVYICPPGEINKLKLTEKGLLPA